jgi:hypothetical protein
LDVSRFLGQIAAELAIRPVDPRIDGAEKHQLSSRIMLHVQPAPVTEAVDDVPT